jgi:glyoxylase-like metal-dependent hydrolase (beta-lactamase superfamily II)
MNVHLHEATAHAELTPGMMVTIARGVRRLVAPNPSPLTGAGTNTYLIGEPPIAVLDPGPAIPVHLEAIASSVTRLETVFVTHTHPDHSPGASRLAARTGARLVGRSPPSDGRQDESFVSDHEPARDERFEVGGLHLRAIDTPGHASNHVCYLLEEEGLLFSGDHVLDGVTPVILAPDGDMAAYLEALRRLKTYGLRAIAPGHGRILSQPREVIDGVIAHRERRERKVLASLEALRRATLEQLLPRVYDDVRAELHELARFSLEAHLIKLEREGRCARQGACWLAR